MTGPQRFPCEVAVPAEGLPVCAERARPWVLAATILASSMAFIDGSVVNVALPAIQRGLSGQVTDLQWVVNAYALTLAALLLTGGAAGDLYGRRRVFAAGILSFAVASAGCGVAQSTAHLVIARAFQGVGAALLVPNSLAILGASFADEARGKAIGTWAGAAAITTAAGPILGGWLVETWSWRAIFFINLPVAAVALGITWRFVPRVRGDGGKLDGIGAAAVTAGLALASYGLIGFGDAGGDPRLFWAVLGAGAVLLGGFVVYESRVSRPMIPLELFRSRSFAGANVLTLLVYFSLSGALFFVPLNLIQVQGYSATAAGAAFLPFTLVMGVLGRWSGGLVDRYGPRGPLVVGPLVVAGGFLALALPTLGGPYWTTFFPGMLVLGLGMAVTVSPLTTTVLDTVPERRTGVASGVNNAASRLAGALAVAVMGVVAVTTFSAELGDRLAALPLSSELQRELMVRAPGLAGMRLPDGVSAELRGPVTAAIDQSFIAGFRVLMWIAAGLSASGALVAALSLPGRGREGVA